MRKKGREPDGENEERRRRNNPPHISAEGCYCATARTVVYFAGAAAGAAAVPVGVDVGAEAGAAGFGASCFWHPANSVTAAMPRTAIIAIIFFTFFTPFFPSDVTARAHRNESIG